MSNEPIDIDFVSDIACPWCAVGLYALEQALRDTGLAARIRFQPFELNPQMPPEGADTRSYLQAKYGLSDAQIAQNRATLRERGAAVGFEFGERTRVWNTFDAHRLLHAAGEQDLAVQGQLKHALLKAYHGQGRNPADPAVLRELGQAAGVQATAAVLADPSLHAFDVRQAQAFWQQAGLRAVPSVVLKRQLLVQGGQPPEAFAQALQQAAQMPAVR